jgi:menaquinone reductase, iron-sulfur cluster-binding subunit
MKKQSRYSLLVDLDRCDGCGACAVACAIENNVAVPPAEAGPRKAVLPLRVEHVVRADGDAADAVFLPIMCQHCQHHTPCLVVCPQTAVDLDPQTGIVSQIPDRCLGCRYCMAACPYHTRSFNWWQPRWDAALADHLAPDVAVRQRGVVEKCNLCHGRWQRAQDQAAAEGRRDLRPGEFVPACVEACSCGAMHVVDLLDPDDPWYDEAYGARAFHLLDRFGTEPSVTYLSARAWVRCIDDPRCLQPGAEVGHV